MAMVVKVDREIGKLVIDNGEGYEKSVYFFNNRTVVLLQEDNLFTLKALLRCLPLRLPPPPETCCARCSAWFRDGDHW